MIDYIFRGGRYYWGWITFLVVLTVVGGVTYYLQQYQQGLTITGMSKEVSWGLYIANFTFLVGAAASAVVVVLPAYLYDYKKFTRITTIAEYFAASMVLMAILFVLVDLGKPDRILNVILHPNSSSVLIYDVIVLNGYLVLNLVIATAVLSIKSKYRGIPSWLKILIYIAIPWAISIHTVTAFIYGGLTGREFWNTALMAPKFLAGAFASGPSLLILVGLALRRYTNFDPGLNPLKKLSEIVTFAMIINIFMIAADLFTTFYSGQPHHLEHFNYLYFGVKHGGEVFDKLIPWIWISLVLGVIAVFMLVFNPKGREKPRYLAAASALIFISVWMEKGIGLIIPAYIPSQVGTIVEYWPTIPETLISLGVWGIGLLVFTLLAKVTIGVTLKTSVPDKEEAVEKEEEVEEEEVKEHRCELCEAKFKSLDECCEHAEKEHQLVKSSCDMACVEVEE